MRATSPALAAAVIALAAIATSVDAVAQGSATAWPQRAIKLVVPYPAGSSPDTLARLYAVRLGAALGQPLVVDNRPGAGGNLGTGLVANTASDQHTLLYTTGGPLVTAPLLVKQLGYDGFKDLMPVRQVATSPLILVADARLGIRSMGDLVKLARQRAGQLNYGSVGIGSSPHLAMELIKTRAGIDLVHVPYPSAPAAVTAILGDQIQVAFMVPGVAAPHVQSGKLVALGMSSASRLPTMPEVPTIAEQGFADFQVVAWHAVMAPAGTSPAVIDRVSRETAVIVASDAFRQALAAQHFVPSELGPVQLAATMRSEFEMWTKVVRDAGVQPE